MRDLGAEGPQGGSGRRDAAGLARRRGTSVLTLLDAAALAAAILAFAVALTLWNIGNLPPGQALVSIRSALRGRGLATVALRAGMGLAAVLAGTLIVLEVVPYSDPQLVPVSLIVFFAAIVVEQLLGAEVRARIPRLFGEKGRRHG